MAFPRDETERNQAVARFDEAFLTRLEKLMRDEPEFQPYPLSKMIGAFFGRLLEPLGGFSILHDAPAFTDITERVFNRIWPGVIAGDLLIHLLQLRAGGIEASVNKAVAIEVDFLSDATTASGAPGGGRGERYVRNAWEDLKPACHLWAAFRLWGLQGRPPELSLFKEDGIDGFLAVSQVLFRMASSLKSKSRREMLLNIDEMWQVSRRYHLPPVRVVIPPLEDRALEVLRHQFKSLRD